MNDKNQKTAEK